MSGTVTKTHDGGRHEQSACTVGTLSLAIDTSASAVNVVLGFKPRMLMLFQTAPVERWHIWVNTMTHSTGAPCFWHMETSAGAASGGFHVTSGQIPTEYSGSDGEGFTLPAAFPYNVDGAAFHFVAWR
jgi:hypothetical protein